MTHSDLARAWALRIATDYALAELAAERLIAALEQAARAPSEDTAPVAE